MAFSQEELNNIIGLAKSSPTATVEVRKEKTALRKAGERTLGGALKVIDFVERPYYAMMNVGVDYYGGDEGFSPLKAFGRGLAGKEKSDFDDVLTEAGWQPESMVGKLTKAGVSFVGGVALDPITYLTFGTGKGIQLGGKMLSSHGTKEFLKNLSKQTGKKINKSSDIKKYSEFITGKMYGRAGEKVLTEAYKNPNIYFNKTAMRFAGKEIPKTADFVEGMGQGVSKVLHPLMSIEVGRETVRGGKMAKKSLGEMFDPYYGIKHSRNLTAEAKSKLLMKLEGERSAKAWQEMDTINETRQTFKNFGKKKRDDVTFEMEKLLKYGQLEKTSTAVGRVVREAGKAKDTKIGLELTGELMRGTQTPFTLIEAGRYTEALQSARWIKARATTDADKHIVNSVMGEVRAKIAQETFNEDNVAKMIKGIKDKEVRKIVETFNKRMSDLWKLEISAGARKKTKPINAGYVKRIMTKAMHPEDVNNGFFNSRKLGGLNIKEAQAAFKKGNLDYMFETDAAKLYAARINESNLMIMRKQMADWMSSKGFMKKAGKTQTEGMTQIKLWGKYYEAPPEIAREMSKLAPQLSDVGMKKFLKTYDKIQNAWKLSVTSIWPSFHARNAVSNVWLGWLGGNTSPGTYELAGRLQWYGHNIKLGKSVKDEVVKVGNRQFKMSELWKMGGESGVIGTGWFGGDFIKKLAISKGDLSYWTRAPRRLGTVVENNARIALFVDRLGKGDDVFSAAQHTKKFLFDYGHLTETERKLFKRIVPFYTWMRKNIALQLEQMAKQPGKYTGMLHAQRATESMSGAEDEKFLPEWMREEELYVRLPGKKYFNPDLPFQDLAKVTMSDKVIREIVSPISPLIKGIFEIAANKDLFRDKPLADKRLPASKFAREKIKKELLNNMRFNTMYKKASDDDKDLLDKFLDLLLGLKVTPFDTKQGREFYQMRKTQERAALRKLQEGK